jgi:hypothetical protein
MGNKKEIIKLRAPVTYTHGTYGDYSAAPSHTEFLRRIKQVNHNAIMSTYIVIKKFHSS